MASVSRILFLIALSSAPLFSQYQTLGPNSCGLGQAKCHAYENNWWIKDNHYSTTDKFYGATPNVMKIANAYGLTMPQTYASNSKCMTCHGTLISGGEAQDIDIGVSCESCHGAGSGYKDPHTEGDPVQTLNRPGYIKALKLGMIENKNLIIRAKTCSRCHNITEAKLITAGHPDGKDFDYIRGLRKVSQHWKRPLEDAGQLRIAFASVLASVPISIAITTPSPIIPPPKRDSVLAPIIQAQRIQIESQISIPTIPQTDIVFAPSPQIQSTKIPPPFPIIPDSLSDYEKAIILKRHIDLLLKLYKEN